MRVALLTKSTLAHTVGGVEVHAEGLAHGLAAHGHEVVVFTTTIPGPSRATTDGIEVRSLETQSGVYSRRWFARSADAVIGRHRATPFDVIVSEDLAGSGLIGRAPGIPHLVFVHGLSLEHVVSYWRDVDGIRALVRYPVITVPELLYYAGVHERRLIRHATLLGCVNARLVAQLRSWHRVEECRLRLFPCWVDAERFAPNPDRRARSREALGLPPDAFVFMTASVVTRQKGVQLAVEAFARERTRDPHARLVVVGDGPYRARLESKCRALGLEGCCRLVGEVPPARMPDYFAAADAFIFPTLRMESTGIVLLEAMAAGLPVAASAIAAVPEVVGDAGLLVRAGDVGALAEAMRRLAQDPGLRAGLAVRGRARVVAHYSKPDVIARIEAECRELAGPRA